MASQSSNVSDTSEATAIDSAAANKHELISDEEEDGNDEFHDTQDADASAEDGRANAFADADLAKKMEAAKVSS